MESTDSIPQGEQVLNVAPTFVLKRKIQKTFNDTVDL